MRVLLVEIGAKSEVESRAVYLGMRKSHADLLSVSRLLNHSVLSTTY